MSGILATGVLPQQPCHLPLPTTQEEDGFKNFKVNLEKVVSFNVSALRWPGGAVMRVLTHQLECCP